MNHQFSESSINLPSIVDIVSAAMLLKELKSATQSHSVKLHAHQVERITTPGVQLILSAAKTMAEKGGKLIVQSPSEAFTDTFIDLGLHVQLKEWSNL